MGGGRQRKASQRPLLENWIRVSKRSEIFSFTLSISITTFKCIHNPILLVLNWQQWHYVIWLCQTLLFGQIAIPWPQPPSSVVTNSNGYFPCFSCSKGSPCDTVLAGTAISPSSSLERKMPRSALCVLQPWRKKHENEKPTCCGQWNRRQNSIIEQLSQSEQPFTFR